ncbi:MAG: hypothetical protein GY827_05455 [Cytophagales bacterium]|nr:hypothetical protein [Cytophagales bacterium]
MGNELKNEEKLPKGMMSYGNEERLFDDDELESGEGEEKKRKGLFSFLTSFFDVEKFLGVGVPVRFLPYVFYVLILGIIHIAGLHYLDRIKKDQVKLKSQVEELRADYTTLKASYMYKSKKSQVRKRVTKLGLIEGSRPPYKIVVEKSEH